MKKKNASTALIVRPEGKADPKAREKMSIYDYEEKYVKRQNVRGAKFFLRFAAAFIGLFLFLVMLLVFLKVYEVNEYVGYGVAAVELIAFVFVFIVPVVKVLGAGYFETNVNGLTVRAAKKHNRRLRHEISDKIIDLTAKVEGVGWYDSEVVGRLAIARKTGDEEKLKNCLTELYGGSVKRSARDLIIKSALKAGAYSAVSQSAHLDAALIAIVNLQLVKDLVFLYGFRPSDARLVKIFGVVIQNSLIAYGLGGMNLGGSVVKTMGKAIQGIPILGTAISALVDSSVQGLANGTLTAVIGYQTISYLNKEYRLQDILDGVDVSQTEEELTETYVEIEQHLKRGKKAKYASAV